VSRLTYIVNILFLAAVFSLLGCVSSEETGGGDRAISPVKVYGSIDSAHLAGSRYINQDSIRKLNNSFNISDQSLRAAPKLKSKQDTVRASIIRKKKTFKRQYIKIERPEHPIYTVQIGAFTQASKALSTQKRAKEQFIYQPVFNKYIKKAKLYRVSVGRYENREDAFALADTMKEQYPGDYNKCWINFIP
jgi:hypothetical protein